MTGKVFQTAFEETTEYEWDGMWHVCGGDIKIQLNRTCNLNVGSKAQADKYRNFYNYMNVI